MLIHVETRKEILERYQNSVPLPGVGSQHAVKQVSVKRQVWVYIGYCLTEYLKYIYHYGQQSAYAYLLASPHYCHINIRRVNTILNR